MASSNKCSVCSKGVGTCYCPGCEKYFCNKDFREHRGMLSDGLDQLTVDRNELQEKINRINAEERSNGSLLSRIDVWQEETIQKVKQAAQQARQQVSKVMNAKQEEITAQFQTLSEEMRQLRETENVLEQDLSRLKQQIGRLHRDLEKLSQSSRVELNTNQSEQIAWDHMIYAEDKSVTSARKPHHSQIREEKPVPPPPVKTILSCNGHACKKCCNYPLFI